MEKFIDSPKVIEKPLKNRYQLFVNAYLVTQNAAEAARNAGYKSKRPAIVGYRLLKKPVIRDAIQAYQKLELEKSQDKLKAHAISKESYIDTAWKEYERVEEEPTKIRALELAGKALGYIGASSDQNPKTQNIQINMVNINGLSAEQCWEKVRDLLDQ